jgi:hypothetical protein
MLDIDTFDQRSGGSAPYKALAHPVAALCLARLTASLNARGRTAVYDPQGVARTLFALNPMIEVEGLYVSDTEAVDEWRGTHRARSLAALGSAKAATVLVAAFDAARMMERIAGVAPPGVEVLSLDAVKLPLQWLTNERRYLDPLNFSTNFVFFRDDDHFGTRLSTANYWAAYGARTVRLMIRLYDRQGTLLADWEYELPRGAGGVVIDSGEVRARFQLPAFTGQLFVHAVGVVGHDVLKYVLETYSTDGGSSLSCTHDANAWPADRYAGMPAPARGEKLILWLQNSHAVCIPAGVMALDRMGANAPVSIDVEIPPFASLPLDVAELLPGHRWPAQIELRAGSHLVRPRYEIQRRGRTRIAHLNVERSDLSSDPGIKRLASALGRGFLLPFPVLPRAVFRTIVQPTPMAVTEMGMPLRIELFRADGTPLAQRYLGVLPRDHAVALDLDEMLEPALLEEGGHAELLYDFREGGDANGWLHALFRYEHRSSGHVAESSFGAHLFNTLMTYKDEPQSYSGPAPGLSTKLFWKIGGPARDDFCALIYPASASWHPFSSTILELYRGDGDLLASREVRIPCSGSVFLQASRSFDLDVLRRAGDLAYVLVRDRTCRLFGFHGMQNRAGAFAFDHMFGF